LHATSGAAACSHASRFGRRRSMPLMLNVAIFTAARADELALNFPKGLFFQ
jgi:hypothetical protein